MARFPSYRGRRAVLATMHAKQKVIAPVLFEGLGLFVEPVPNLDTDKFGTFTRDVARTGSQLGTARAKIAAAFDLVPDATIAIASEGSFGPDPQLHFVPAGFEVVMLRDRLSGLELLGTDRDPATNFGHAVVTTMSAAFAFTESAGFSDHGVVVIGCEGGTPRPDMALTKTIDTPQELGLQISSILDRYGAAFLEADMRAFRNPTRMRAIG